MNDRKIFPFLVKNNPFSSKRKRMVERGLRLIVRRDGHNHAPSLLKYYHATSFHAGFIMKYSPARNPHSNSCYAILIELPWPDTDVDNARGICSAKTKKNQLHPLCIRTVNPIWITKQRAPIHFAPGNYTYYRCSRKGSVPYAWPGKSVRINERVRAPP